jgi:hypothetical protein
MNLRIHVDNIDISKTVLEVGDFVCESETRNIWEYRLDVYNFTAHIDLLTLLNLTTANYYNLIKKNVKVYHRNVLLFSGSIASVKYSFLKKSLDINCDSLGLMAVKMLAYPDSGTDKFFATSGSLYHGDSLQRILAKLTSNINYNLLALGYDFFLTGFETNVLDFPIYQSLVLSPIRIYNGANMVFRGIYFRKDYSDPYLLFTLKNIADTYGEDPYERSNSVAISFNYATISFITGTTLETSTAPGIERFRLFFNPSDNKYYHLLIDGQLGEVAFFRKNSTMDSYYLKRAESLYGENLRIMGFVSFPENSIYPETSYLAINNLDDDRYYVIRYTKNKDEKFDYSYDEGITAGVVLKDFAILTDSIFWISPHGKIIYQNRKEHTSQQIDISSSDLSDYQSENVSYDTTSVPLPDEVILGDEMREELLSYYQAALSKSLLRTQIECPFGALNQNPMLSQLFIDGESIGIVKRFELSANEMITITAEKRI